MNLYGARSARVAACLWQGERGASQAGTLSQRESCDARCGASLARWRRPWSAEGAPV